MAATEIRRNETGRKGTKIQRVHGRRRNISRGAQPAGGSRENSFRGELIRTGTG